MLMLYFFRIDVYDRDNCCSYVTGCSVIGATRDDRHALIRHQFGLDKDCVVKHSVLLGARVLTLHEVRLLEIAYVTLDTLWLTSPSGVTHGGALLLRLPRVHTQLEMREHLKRTDALDLGRPLYGDQFVHSTWFCRGQPSAKPVM